jgi:hypothetical protein
MSQEKKPLSETRGGLLIAALAGIPGGPIGIFASPLILYLLTFFVKGKDGKNPNRFLPWFLIGIIGVPVCLLPFTGPSPRVADSVDRQATQTVPPALKKLPSSPVSSPARPGTTEPEIARDVPSFDDGYKPNAETRLSAPQPVPQSDTSAKNTTVTDNLNAADGLFKSGQDGCSSVSLAIMAANNPDVYGPVSPEQVSELKEYAEKCRLRY